NATTSRAALSYPSEHHRSRHPCQARSASAVSVRVAVPSTDTTSGGAGSYYMYRTAVQIVSSEQSPIRQTTESLKDATSRGYGSDRRDIGPPRQVHGGEHANVPRLKFVYKMRRCCRPLSRHVDAAVVAQVGVVAPGGGAAQPLRQRVQPAWAGSPRESG